MNIYVVNQDLLIENVIDTYESVIWNNQYFGLGDFELVVSAEWRDILTKGKMLVRESDISNGEMHNVMLIRRRVISFDIDKGWILTVTGASLKALLHRRVIYNQINILGNLESGIRQVITENVISPTIMDRQISNFQLAPAVGITLTKELQLFGEHIDEWLEATCTENKIGWEVYIAGGNYIFQLLQGTDRTYNQSDVTPVVFSRKFDNLISYEYDENYNDYKTAAIVGGEGDGINQRTAIVGSGSGLDRYEMFVDGSNVSSNGEIITLETYLGMLRDYGLEEIAQTKNNVTFSGELIPYGMYDFNKDYFLGDFVQVDADGITAVTQIIEMIYAEDRDGWSLIPTFSEFER